jgi:hypothetical protein
VNILPILLPFCVLAFGGCGSPEKKKDAPDLPFKNPELDKKYQTQAFLNPSFLTADFNGDGNADQAHAVIEKKTGKKGLLVLHGNSDAYFVFGAGTRFGEDDDDYQWADLWRLYTDKTAFETQFDEETGDIIGGKEVKLQHPGLLLMAEEDGSPYAGGIIYWDGRQYVWIHQGE